MIRRGDPIRGIPGPRELNNRCPGFERRGKPEGIEREQIVHGKRSVGAGFDSRDTLSDQVRRSGIGSSAERSKTSAFDTAIASSQLAATPSPAQKIGYFNPKAAIKVLHGGRHCAGSLLPGDSAGVARGETNGKGYRPTEEFLVGKPSVRAELTNKSGEPVVSLT